jgi:hypothetical protein
MQLIGLQRLFNQAEYLPKQNDLRNFLMSPECAEMAQRVANLA